MQSTIEIWESLRQNTIRVNPDVSPEEMLPDTSLADLGCSSLDRADIIAAVMDDLTIEVPLSEFRQGASLEELVATLQRHLS